MSITGIASARHKLARAEHHIADLEQGVRSFADANPIEIHALWKPSATHRGELDCEVIALTEPADVPEVWSLITGDALTCLRATLDHAVYPHARQFPTFASRTKPGGGANTFKEIYSPAVTEIIESSQPYHSEVPHHDPIAVLAALVNMDKHRQLLVTNGFTTQVLIMQPKGYEITNQEPQRGENLAKGDVIFKYRIRPTGVGDVKFEYHRHLLTEPVIDIPETDGYRPLVPLLKDIHTRVGDILDQLTVAGLP
ncbi:hypothetical protein [Nocardia sp. NPDC005745]|uniref:hypothetical protein n=1 Tax=Nocardia sp. NPDC005745 TaxID=3157061 RepID=UPI0033DEBA03